jgi:DMSO reductase anchor subunit
VRSSAWSRERAPRSRRDARTTAIVKPALSVILFTVLSGAGLGALALVALAELGSRAAGETLVAQDIAMLAATAGLALVVAGLCASTLHLANPRNAWRSLARWRTSWLSREALAALGFVPLAALYVAAIAAGLPGVAAWLAAPVVALAWAMLYCTAMIYASLAPIRQWHTRRVPLAFWLLAHASGALLVVAVASVEQYAPRVAIATALAFLALGLLAKLEYWRFVGSARDAPTLARAIGAERGVVQPGRGVGTVAARLLDVGHTKGTFLTREFVHTPSASRRRALRSIAVVAGFLLPGVWLIAGETNWRGGVGAFLACMIGLSAERWLFFAEARHTVRLYHGAAT